MKTIFTLRTGLLLAFIMALTNMAAQTTGDYRTNANTALNTKTGWDIWNGSAWIPASIPPFGNNTTFTQNGNTSTSTSVTLTAAHPLIRVNQIVAGSGVPAGTTVSSISGTALTLSNATTTTVSNTPLTFFSDQFVTAGTCTTTSGSAAVTLTANTYPIVVDMAVTGTGIPNGTKVLSVASSTSITLSANATSSSTTAALTFYTKEISATIVVGSTTITLAAANDLVQPGMLVSSIANFTNNYFTNGTTVTSVDATKTIIGISQPVPNQAVGVIPVIFGYNVIPNLYVNHTVTGASSTNTKLSTIGNVYVNNASNAYPLGTVGTTPANATLSPAPGNSSLSIAFKTLNVASSATVDVGLPTTGSPNSTLALYGIGNVINNNGTIDFTTSIYSTYFGKLSTNIISPGSNTITGTGTFIFGSLNVSNSGTNVALAANCVINNVPPSGTVLTSIIGSGTSLTINEGYVLSNINAIAAGTITNSGNLILKSSAAGTASLLSTTTVANVTQQRYLSSNQRGWRLLSNPLATTTFNPLATASGITLGTNYTGEYLSPSNTWTSTDGSASMATQKAYKVFITGLTGEAPAYTSGPSNVTLVNKGTATNTEPATIAATANQFYLVGNPYTAPISLKAILDANAFLSKTVSYYDPTVGSTDVKVKFGGYTTKDTSTSVASGDANDVVIPPMGAIFVQATSVGNISVPKTAIYTGTITSPAGNYNHKTAQTKVASANALKVEVSSDGTYYDSLALQFKAVGDAGSNIDFGKLPNTILDAYSFAGTQKMAVSELELKDQIIPLGITSTIQKNYNFKVVDNTIPAGYEAVLVDNVLNTNTVLTPGTSYNFTVDSTPASQGDARFAINLRTAGSLGVATNELDDSIQVYPNPSRGQFNINNTLNQKEDATIEISSLNGQVIHTQKLNSGTTTIQTKSWAAGVYILKATNNGTQTTKKLLIQ